MSFGAASDRVLLIESGTIKVILSEHNGAQVVTGPYGPGELIGELGVLEGRPRSATVVANQRGTAIRVPAQVFRDLAGRDQDVMVLINVTLRDRLHNADKRQLAIASQDVATRVATQLLAWARTLGEPAGAGLLLRGIPQSDLARAVVASEKSVDSALRALRADGLVSTSRLRFHLLDPNRLEYLLTQPRWRPGATPSP
ncbi:hypothetical protein GCM10027445_61890 [Amycolatopsis endophytica]